LGGSTARPCTWRWNRREDVTTRFVFATGGDPVEFGIVSNLARPERNLTGVGGTILINYKRLQLINRVVPGAKRVAFLTNVENPIHGHLIRAADRDGRQLGPVQEGGA
jgi:ABC-type uncharacterized transport system substrate-binding protein